MGALLIATLVALYFVLPSYRAFVDEGWELLRSGDDQRIAGWFAGFGLWGPILILGLMLLQMVIFFLPSWLPMVVAVLAYGEFFGAALSIGGVAAISSLAYLLGEVLSDKTLHRITSESTRERLGVFVERYGVGAVALFRLSPFLSNDAISFVAGIVRMGYWRFLLATLLGITPLAVAIAWFARDIDTLRSGLLWIGGGGLVLYAAFIAVDHWRRERPRKVTES